MIRPGVAEIHSAWTGTPSWKTFICNGSETCNCYVAFRMLEYTFALRKPTGTGVSTMRCIYVEKTRQTQQEKTEQ